MRSDSVTAALKDMRQTVAAPRAAAVAGVIFAVLLIVSLGLVRLAVPADPSEPGSWLIDPDRRSALRVALNLVPFAGIAFLWFLGVIRSRLGTQEDQFLATVLLGSGVLFVACVRCNDERLRARVNKRETAGPITIGQCYVGTIDMSMNALV